MLKKPFTCYVRACQKSNMSGIGTCGKVRLWQCKIPLHHCYNGKTDMISSANINAPYFCHSRSRRRCTHMKAALAPTSSECYSPFRTAATIGDQDNIGE